MEASPHSRALLLGALLAWAGCSFVRGAGSGRGDASNSLGDASSTDSIDSPLDTCVTVTDLGIDLCPMNAAGPGLEITMSTTLHTDDGVTTPTNMAIRCAPMKGGSTPNVCAIYATTIKIDAGVTLGAFGNKPLVLLATSSIDIEGTVDVSSHIGGAAGPGSSHAGCSQGTNPSFNGGGQGGSYGAKGGNGGDTDGGSGTGGLAGSAFVIGTLQGGCPGASGAGGAMGGAAGGAVLLATPTLTIGNAGQIDASGAAGRGGATGRHGGGGAGSGGLIAISVGAITLVGGAQIYANGSHGGGGSSSTQGVDGADPTSATSGGSSGSAGGSGGAGAAGAVRGAVAGNGAPGTANNDGGGGGGGGAGEIYIRPITTVVTNNPNVSPAPI